MVLKRECDRCGNSWKEGGLSGHSSSLFISRNGGMDMNRDLCAECTRELMRFLDNPILSV